MEASHNVKSNRSTMESKSVQAIPVMACHEVGIPTIHCKNFCSTHIQRQHPNEPIQVNTETPTSRTYGMNHVEGGWPKEVDHTDAEQVARWKKRVERDEQFIKTVVKLGAVMNTLIKENNCIDLYEDYFPNIEEHSESLAPSMDILTSLQILKSGLCSVQSIVWQPEDGGTTIAVAYGLGLSPVSSTSNPSACCIWNIENPSKPITSITSHSPVSALAYHTKDHSILAAGQGNGQLTIYDIRKSTSPTDSTPATASHTAAVTGAAWVQCKSGTEVVTCSADGHVVWWDTRKLGERLEVAVLKDRNSSKAAAETKLSASCLEYSAAAGPTKFMVGTAQGHILSGNRRANAGQDRVTNIFTGHNDTVFGLSRHPFFPKYFSSVGDWSMRVWADDLKTAITVTPFRTSALTSCAWSKSKASVVYAGSRDGGVEAWDLLQSHAEPALRVQVSDTALTALSLQEGDHPSMFAVGGADGGVTVLRMGGSLVEEGGQGGKEAFLGMLEREAASEKHAVKYNMVP